jgi:hypothetical protein
MQCRQTYWTILRKWNLFGGRKIPSVPTVTEKVNTLVSSLQACCKTWCIQRNSSRLFPEQKSFKLWINFNSIGEQVSSCHSQVRLETLHMVPKVPGKPRGYDSQSNQKRNVWSRTLQYCTSKQKAESRNVYSYFTFRAMPGWRSSTSRSPQPEKVFSFAIS